MLLSALSVAFTLGIPSGIPRDSVSDQALAILTAADQKLAAATSIQAKYVDTAEYRTPFRDLRQTGTVTLSRPSNIRIEIDRARRVTSGDPWRDTGNRTLRVGSAEGQYAVFFHPNSTQVRKANAVAAVPESSILTAFFGGPTSPSQVFTRAKTEGTLTDVKIEGQELSFRTGAVSRQIEIGVDGLIHQIKETDSAKGDVKTVKIDWIRLDESVAPELFTYAPPKDALPYERAERQPDLEIGTEAPDFSLTDSNGNLVTRASLKGKVIVLKFWATWCWPCNQSMPETESLAKRYADQGVVTLAVAIKDSKKGFDAWVKGHLQFGHVNFAFEDPVRSPTSTAYRVTATPTTYIIGRDGEISEKFEGFTGPNPAIAASLDRALKQSR